jgi:hypothetical protein
MKVKVIEAAMPVEKFSLLQSGDMKNIVGGLTKTESCKPVFTVTACYMYYQCGTDPNGYAEPAYSTETLDCWEYFTWKRPCTLAGKCPLLG